MLASYRTLAVIVVVAAVSSAAPGCDEKLPASLTSSAPLARFETRPANAACLAEALPLGPVRLEPAFQGLYRPLRMVDRPDRGLVYFAEMPGRIKAVDKTTGVITTALDLVGKVASFAEQGLFGLAIHPTKPFAYVTVDREHDATSLKDLPFRSEILRFTIASDGKTFDPASEKLVIRVDRQSALHTAGNIEFGPDGFLYIGVGDGGRDVLRWPADQLLGSILRLDVDTGDPYAIPASNPYSKGGGRPEIFAGGFRNPWRFSFDRKAGDLWVGDVGDVAFEEIDRVEVGRNYGFPVFEGPRCVRPTVSCDATGLTPPVYAYSHAEGTNITGGYVYRGAALPELAGKYIYADFGVGHVRSLDGAGDSARVTFLNPGGPKPRIASFGEDAVGELYVLGWDDNIVYKLVRGDDQPKPTFASRLSQTGCVDPADARKMATGLVPYGVNVELWSDGAEKRRFVAIPDGTKIHVAENGHFDLPTGSIAVKEFVVDGKRIETRLLRHHPDGGWTGATYEWNDEQTDATVLESAKEKVLANGQTWQFPSPIQCLICHTANAGDTLGTEALQLNRDFDYVPGQRTNQLTTLADIGYVDQRLEPGSTPRLPELTGTAPLADRARAYLHANCSICHREGGGTDKPMDFRFGLPLSSIRGCTPASYPGVGDTKIIVPGDPGRSTLMIRLTSRGYATGGMPPLGTERVDEVASGVIASWIASLGACE